MDLLNKIRGLRDEAQSSGAVAGSNTKTPIYDRIEQQKVLSRIESTLGETYSLFWRVSVSTGARTSDVCNMKFSDVDLDSGIWSYTVSKQSKSAEARAYNKVLKMWKERLKREAMLNGDQQLYMQIDMADFKNITEFVTGKDSGKLEADLTEAVNNAPIKRDSKKLPTKVIEIIKERLERNYRHDGNVFSRCLTGSNRAKNQDGAITRQTVWKALKGVFSWFSETVNASLKLSTYSSRKIFAYRMLKGVNGKENNISETMQAFGHSSIQMTMKYLGLASRADELQAQLSEV